MGDALLEPAVLALFTPARCEQLRSLFDYYAAGQEVYNSARPPSWQQMHEALVRLHDVAWHLTQRLGWCPDTHGRLVTLLIGLLPPTPFNTDYFAPRQLYALCT
jgi:hypothetical protein